MHRSITVNILRIILFTTLITGCGRLRNIVQHKGTLPGMVALSDSTEIDEYELSNQGYKECLYWYDRFYGDTSEKFLSMIPKLTFDSADRYATDKDYKSYCLYNPDFRDWPVLGLSLDQISAYAQWRADRVSEMMLIRDGYLRVNHKSDTSDMFTIKKLLEGSIELKKPLPDDYLVPVYHLTTYDEWKHARERNVIRTAQLSKESLSLTSSPCRPYYIEVLQHGDSTRMVNWMMMDAEDYRYTAFRLFACKQPISALRQ